MQTQKTDTTLPKAYLNYLMFDEGFNMLPDLSGAIQVEQANAWQNMDVPQFEIPQNGYLYIFTSNQSQTTVSTDNLYLYHWQSRLLEEFNYYPFGLTFEVTHAQNLQGSDVRYNSQSIERNEFTDNTNAKFGLNWYDFMARSYDVQLGRWMQPDPMMQHASPYLAMANNPTSFTDPLGLTAQDHIGIDIATGREVARAKSSGKDVYYSVRATGRDTWESLDILDNYIPFGKLASSLGFTPETDDYSRADNLQINYAPNVVNDYRIRDQQNADRAKFNSVVENGQRGWGGLSGTDKAGYGLNSFGFANGAKTEIIDYAVRSGSSQAGIRAELQILGKTGTRYLSLVKDLSKKAAWAGVVVTSIDAGVKGEWQNHHTADVLIGVGSLYLLTGPVGWAVGGGYFLLDVGIKYSTGKSITENLFDKP